MVTDSKSKQSQYFLRILGRKKDLEMKKAQWPLENRRKEKLLWQMDTIQRAHSLVHLLIHIYGAYRRGQVECQRLNS